MRAAAACALAAAVLAGCASLPAPPLPPTEPAPGAVTRFEVGGRLSAKRGSEGVAAHFSWAHAPGFDRVDVATPLGQTLARLVGDGAGVRVERPGQPVESFADWDALTRAIFGVAIPVEGLAAWIVGAPVADLAFGVERDERARPTVLRQRGWEIVYAYAEGAPAQRPSRLVMRYPDVEPVEVRIVIDRWSNGAAAALP
jgi:outer membrane lipoprotein LolB